MTSGKLMVMFFMLIVRRRTILGYEYVIIN